MLWVTAEKVWNKLAAWQSWIRHQLVLPLNVKHFAKYMKIWDLPCQSRVVGILTKVYGSKHFQTISELYNTPKELVDITK